MSGLGCLARWARPARLGGFRCCGAWRADGATPLLFFLAEQHFWSAEGTPRLGPFPRGDSSIGSMPFSVRRCQRRMTHTLSWICLAWKPRGRVKLIWVRRYTSLGVVWRGILPGVQEVRFAYRSLSEVVHLEGRWSARLTLVDEEDRIVSRGYGPFGALSAGRNLYGVEGVPRLVWFGVVCCLERRRCASPAVPSAGRFV